MAIKPKQWLFDNGHTDTLGGRGRMSLAHKALIQAAVASGVNIEGFGVVSSPTAVADAPVEVKRIAVDPNRIADVPNVSRDEKAVMGFYRAEGKVVEIGMRTVDNNCGSSLTYCMCESPRVWVDHDQQVVVLFKPRN